MKTEYTLNGQTVNTYTGPFTVSVEGIIKLKVRSLDNAGNEEEPKGVEIKIDKIAPEVKVFVDPDKLDLIVEGADANSTTVISEPNNETKKKDDAIYTITDIAGNKTRLDVRERDKEKKDRFRIHSIKYNEGNPIDLPNNYFNVSYNGKKDKLNVKEQNFELKGEIKIRIQYNQKKNKSIIIIREPKEEKIKEVKEGLIILQLLSNKGKLEAKY